MLGGGVGGLKGVHPRPRKASTAAETVRAVA